AHSVVMSFIRTVRTLPSQPPALRARTTVPRASSFSRGATASSRSRKKASVSNPRAFSMTLGLEPGTASTDRRDLSSPTVVRSVRPCLYLAHHRTVRYTHREVGPVEVRDVDRKSTRLNSSHVSISYAVFCLKKKNETNNVGPDS